MNEHIIVPSRETDYVSLARVKSGRLFRKHILSKGPLLHPVTGETINIDDAFISTLKKNFDDGVCDIVPFPLADAQNRHTESPLASGGEVVGLEVEDGKVYGIIDVRDQEVVAKLDNKTLLGASAMLSLDYLNTRTGTKSGVCLLHIAGTNRPFVTGLEDYKEIVAASAPTLDDVAILEPQDEPTDETTDKLKEEGAPVPGVQEDTVPPIEEQEKMTLEEMLAELKSAHNIDVLSLQENAKLVETAQAEAKEATDKNAALSASLTAALKDTDVVKLSKDNEITADDIVGAVAELAESNVALSGRVDSLAKESAGTYVDKLVGDGFVLPAQRDTFVELRLSNTELFDKLIPEKPLVAMNVEKGAGEGEDVKKELDVDAEIARLSAPGGAANQYVKSN